MVEEQELADLDISIVFMRMPVPDFVAQAFLKYFLNSFASGKPLYLAVLIARKKLEGWEDRFPYASVLPQIWQKPNRKEPLTWQGMKNSHTIQEPLTWQDLKRPPTRRWRLFQNKVLISLLTTASIIILKLLISPLIPSIFPFHETLPFKHNDIISLRSLECQSEQFDPKWLYGGIEEQPEVGLANNKDGKATQWKVKVDDNRETIVKLILIEDNERKNNQYLDADTTNGNVYLSENAGEGYSGTKWKVHKNDSSKEIIKLENQGEKDRSGIKWLSCQEQKVELDTDGGKNYPSSKWKFDVIKPASR